MDVLREAKRNAKGAKRKNILIERLQIVLVLKLSGLSSQKDRNMRVRERESQDFGTVVQCLTLWRGSHCSNPTQ